MTLAKQWVAECDDPDCDTVTVVRFTPTPVGPERWDAGEALNDLGWQAAPGRKETYCPAHPREDWDQ